MITDSYIKLLTLTVRKSLRLGHQIIPRETQTFEADLEEKRLSVQPAL